LTKNTFLNKKTIDYRKKNVDWANHCRCQRTRIAQ
jgi:hypothetical protein